MGISKPYRRTARPFMDGRYVGVGGHSYMQHPKFASDAVQVRRSFLLLQKDLLELFDYVEPADKNLSCFSFRIHAMLVRTCIEVEANLKGILSDHSYRSRSRRDLTMSDYKKVEVTHRLSAYRVVMPVWRGAGNIRTPFSAWSTTRPGSLPWYTAYNAVKHDRHFKFESASFKNLVDAFCGLVALVHSQFLVEDFSGSGHQHPQMARDSSMLTTGGYCRVFPPDNWAPADRYDFDWLALPNRDKDPFQEFDYSKI